MFNKKLAHTQSYVFFASLPVSKLSLLNANYITVLVFTLVGAGILSLYGISNDNYSSNTININFTLPFSFIFINLFSIIFFFMIFIYQMVEYIYIFSYVMILNNIESYDYCDVIASYI